MVGKIAVVRRQLYDELENSAYDVIQGISVGRTFHLYELQKKRIECAIMIKAAEAEN